MGQFFEHLGFNILDEWYILAEFHGSIERSTKGRMGDIRGKPTKEELKKNNDGRQKIGDQTLNGYSTVIFFVFPSQTPCRLQNSCALSVADWLKVTLIVTT